MGQVAEHPAVDIPDTEAVLTIAPPPCFSMWGIAYLHPAR
jgi:hypothetical protein